MKEFLRKAKLFVYGCFCGIGAVLIALLISRNKPDERETNDLKKAEKAKTDAENSIRSASARSVAERYEDVGDAIAEGRNRFAARVKNRILASGGRRINEQHTD